MAFCYKCGAKIVNEGDPFCSNCGAKVAPSEVSPAPVSQIESKTHCPNCKSEVNPRAQFCWHCGGKLQGTGEIKSKKVVLVLAILVGLLGILGMGHLYLGRLTRGFVLLFVGLAIEVLNWVFIIALYSSRQKQVDYFNRTTYSYNNGWLVGLILVGIVGIALWIWQIFDARRIYREVNSDSI